LEGTKGGKGNKKRGKEKESKGKVGGKMIRNIF
jgi:hypothetical protein